LHADEDESEDMLDESEGDSRAHRGTVLSPSSSSAKASLTVACPILSKRDEIATVTALVAIRVVET
jgi:hypothetical protein